MNWLCLDLKFVVGPWVRTHDMISVDFDFYNPEVQTAFSKKWLMSMTVGWPCLLLSVWCLELARGTGPALCPFHVGKRAHDPPWGADRGAVWIRVH